jgi:23S rRNA (pseudouridine1915-N3)-methyltransferase
MKVKIIAVGTKMPKWVVDGTNEFTKRLPRDLQIEFVEVPLGNRSKGADVKKAIQSESKAILDAIAERDWVVALEVKGKSWTTEALAKQLESWQMRGGNVCLLVGGPDGLSDVCRARADQQWSLSALTLPHPLVRILLAEQLYRAYSINQNHPYHRA